MGKGTGLGLAIVYGIVKQHLGGIWVYSEAGKGSVFKIYFPRDNMVPSEAPAPAAEPGALRGNETVLVVEDDQAVREVVAVLLTSHGYQTLTAPNGAEALALAEHYEGPIHLLLTDVVMPGMNGKELYQRLAGSRTELKALFMSGYTSDMAFFHGVHEGGIEFLRKPFMALELTHRVREVLDG